MILQTPGRVWEFRFYWTTATCTTTQEVEVVALRNCYRRSRISSPSVLIHQMQMHNVSLMHTQTRNSFPPFDSHTPPSIQSATATISASNQSISLHAMY
eukprot:scaffold60_cov137-Skeletonema_marinoi.AAC.2